jgi:hypothetical protein
MRWAKNDSGYARRSYLDWMTPEGKTKAGVTIACVVYLIGFCAWAYTR